MLIWFSALVHKIAFPVAANHKVKKLCRKLRCQIHGGTTFGTVSRTGKRHEQHFFVFIEVVMRMRYDIGSGDGVGTDTEVVPEIALQAKTDVGTGSGAGEDNFIRFAGSFRHKLFNLPGITFKLVVNFLPNGGLLPNFARGMNASKFFQAGFLYS
jgi:hypothetical protein